MSRESRRGPSLNEVLAEFHGAERFSAPQSLASRFPEVIMAAELNQESAEHDSAGRPLRPCTSMAP